MTPLSSLALPLLGWGSGVGPLVEEVAAEGDAARWAAMGGGGGRRRRRRRRPGGGGAEPPPPRLRLRRRHRPRRPPRRPPPCRRPLRRQESRAYGPGPRRAKCASSGRRGSCGTTWAGASTSRTRTAKPRPPITPSGGASGRDSRRRRTAAAGASGAPTARKRRRGHGCS